MNNIPTGHLLGQADVDLLNQINDELKDRKWTDAHMMDFHLATTSTKHPLHKSFKDWVRNNYRDLTSKSLLEWYAKNKLI